MSTETPTQSEKEPKTTKEKAPPSAKELFVRAMVTLLSSEKAQYYIRGERVYIDTSILKGKRLMLLESGEFARFLLQTAKKGDNILLRLADAQLIIEHVMTFALENAQELSPDNRAAFMDGKIVLNTGWKNGQLLQIEPVEAQWAQVAVDAPIFEPIPQEMKLVEPVGAAATAFPRILKEGLADFGDVHCLIAVTCATMLLPATFPHPFLVFTGAQARGKSTTMKLLLQLVDPRAGGELMSIGEDARDMIALSRDRHCVAIDNVSHLPFDEDLLSKMYSGGMFAARKMTTNSELSVSMMPRLRVLMNGIGPAFSRSDLMSRCIFVDHPILTRKDENGHDIFTPIEHVEQRWQAKLPEALGALLTAVAEGWQLYLAQGQLEGKTSRCRYVEYAVIGECMSQVMGFEKGIFTEQIIRAAEQSEAGAVEADDCAQLVLAYLNGERGQSQFAGWDEKSTSDVFLDQFGGVTISSTDLYKEVRQIADARRYTTYNLKWLSSVKAFSTALVKSQKNIESGGWLSRQISGGEHKRKWEFTKVK